jgi:hypothetical protein
MAHRRNNDHDCDENRAHIREVLMQKWDPIGISGICPDDEYDRYDHLLGLAVNAMGLSDKPRSREKCVLAAAALLAMRPELATRGRWR